MKSADFLYAIDDRLPVGRSILYGLQWAAILFPALIISASLASNALQLQPQGAIRFFQFTLLMSGTFSAAQTLWGHRYPLLDGPSTALLLTFLASSGQGIDMIQGGLIVGGVVLVAVGWLKLLSKLLRFFSPNVVGVILLLIAFTLLSHLAPRMCGVDSIHPEGQYLVFVASLALVLLIAALSRWLEGFWQTIAMFFGIVLGSVLFSLLGQVNWQNLMTARWVAVPEQWLSTVPAFRWPTILAFGLAYLAVIVNSVGSIQGIANVTDTERLPEALHRGILMNGLGGICCGLLGVVGMVSYSMSPGVVLVTRVASRFSVTCCGAIIVLAGFLPKLAALLAIIPAPVIGAALCVGLAGQVGAGLAVIGAHQRQLTGRDYLVVGVPVIIGTLVSMLPESFLRVIPTAFQAFLGNGLIVGIVLVLLLEHVLMPRKE
jgi:uracil permease